MKILSTILLLLISTHTFAEEYCAGYKSKIADDHQWNEILFDKEEAIKAIKRLENAVNGKVVLDWYESANYYTQIEGYILKQRIIRHKKISPKDKTGLKIKIDEFCNFIKGVPIVD
ncbi:MAG: hypothetical protein OEY52_14900 [Gammaproteobacteria bacterium]|nr:hypothetical protein [Gammaproteobacteria bacterium]